MKRLLLSPDPEPAPGGPPSESPPKPPVEPPKPPASPQLNQPPPNPPPAAKIVVEGTKTERELALERDLRDVQTRASALEDENRTLKTPKPPGPIPARQKKHWMQSWLDGEEV